MKAVLIDEKTRELRLSEVEKPALKAEEILIEIYAAGVNRADLLQRKGSYPSPAGWPAWMGLEAAGTVAALGSEAAEKSGFRIGDRVCALLGGGGYAEYVCAPWGMVLPIPEGLGFEEAAALPEAFATAYLNLFHEGKLQPGQTVYIPAGGSGLASVAIPMAKAFGARVITSVRSAAKAESIRALGADVVILSSADDVAGVLRREMEAGHPVNLAMDCLGGEALGRCLPYMAEGGFWVLISTLAGTETAVPLRAVLSRGLHLVGSTLRKRSSGEKAELLRELRENVWPKIEDGTLRPGIYRTLRIEQAAEAQAILERCENTGKVVLQLR